MQIGPISDIHMAPAVKVEPAVSPLSALLDLEGAAQADDDSYSGTAKKAADAEEDEQDGLAGEESEAEPDALDEGSIRSISYFA